MVQNIEEKLDNEAKQIKNRDKQKLKISDRIKLGYEVLKYLLKTLLYF